MSERAGLAMHTEAVSGVVLAGGRGQRMGGADKGLLLLKGQPLVTHVLNRLQPQVSSLSINANRNLEIYAAFGYPLLADSTDDFPGPLAGLQAGLAHTIHPWVVSVPCDAPFFPLDLVLRLQQAAFRACAKVAVARTPEGIQPVFCLANRDLLPHLSQFLAAGERRVGAWLQAMKAIEVDFDESAAFSNLNTSDQLEAACRAIP